MITCTGEIFGADDFRACGAPASALLTIAGADRAKGLRPEQAASHYNVTKAPRCSSCLALDRRVVEQFYPDGWIFVAEPIA